MMLKESRGMSLGRWVYDTALMPREGGDADGAHD